MKKSSKILAFALPLAFSLFISFLWGATLSTNASTQKYTVDDVVNITATPKTQKSYEQYTSAGYYTYSESAGYSSVYYLNDDVLFGNDFQYTVTFKSGESITGSSSQIQNTIGVSPRIVHKELVETAQISEQKTADICLGTIAKGSFEFKYKQPSNPVISISVKDYPKKILIDNIQDGSKVWYSLSPEITVTYKDGSTNVVDSHFGVRYGWDKSTVTPGTYPVTIYYHGATTTFYVEVIENPVKGITIIKNPTKTTHFVGEYVNPIGAVIRLSLQDGSYQDVSITKNNYKSSNHYIKAEKLDAYGKFVIDGGAFFDTGSKTVTLSYFGKTCTYDVSVLKNTINKLVLNRDCSGVIKNCIVTHESGKKETLNFNHFWGSAGWLPGYERMGDGAGIWIFGDTFLDCYNVYKGNGVYLEYHYSEEPVHDYSAWSETKAETCTNAAVESRKCSLCKKTETRTGDTATGTHIFGEWKQTKAPTTTSTGTETRKCDYCTKTETRTVAKLSASNTENSADTNTQISTDTTSDVDLPVASDTVTESSSNITDGENENITSDESFAPPYIDTQVNNTNPENNALSGNIGGTENDLKDSILTDEEKNRVEKGEEVKIYLEVKDIEKDVLPEHKDMILKETGDGKVGAWLDINLFKEIGNDDAVKVTETNEKVTITITVPEELWNNNGSFHRNYRIIRVHDGKVDHIPAKFDKKTGLLVFETDRFSTYALVYEDVAIENPDVDSDVDFNSTSNLSITTDNTIHNGENSFHWWIIIISGIAVLSAGGFCVWYFLIFKKK